MFCKKTIEYNWSNFHYHWYGVLAEMEINSCTVSTFDQVLYLSTALKHLYFLFFVLKNINQETLFYIAIYTVYRRNKRYTNVSFFKCRAAQVQFHHLVL